MRQLQTALGTAVIALSSASAASAQTSALGTKPTGVPEQFATFARIISSAFNITIAVSGVIFVFLLLLGGVQYLTSLGNDDSAVKARKVMINAAIGLVIVLTAFAIGNYVLSLLGIDQTVGTSVNSGRAPIQ